MNRTLVSIAVVVALAALLLVFLPRPSSSSPSSADVAPPTSSKRPSPSDLPNPERLRRLAKTRPTRSASFENIEVLVTDLSDAELTALRDDVSKERADSVAGWVRAAVFAEIARRDPEAALTFLKEDEPLWRYDQWSLRQAWFSTFRGWAEEDPEAAAAGLEEFAPPGSFSGQSVEAGKFQNSEAYLRFIRRDESWRQQATLSIYATWARDHPKLARRAVQQHDDSAEIRNSSLEGVFRGVVGTLSAEHIERLWGPRRLFSLSSRNDSLPQQDPERPRLLDPMHCPTEFSASAQVAVALEISQPGRGEEWLGNLEHGVDYIRKAAMRGHFLEQIAHRHPERILTMIEKESEGQGALVAALFNNHPALAAEVLGSLDDPAERETAVEFALHRASYLHLEDLFPSPGRSNQLPDWQRRYENLTNFIAAGHFDRDNALDLNRQVDHRFAQLLNRQNKQ